MDDMGKSLYITFQRIRRRNEKDLLIDNTKDKVNWGRDHSRNLDLWHLGHQDGVADRNGGVGP